MIYIDSSVALAQLLVEQRRPADRFWTGALVSSRLLEYEVWNRVHRRGLTETHGSAARAFLGGIRLMDLSARVIGRALEPFPVTVRTLDSLHLATMLFLIGQDQELTLAAYDRRLVGAAQACGIELSRDL